MAGKYRRGRSWYVNWVEGGRQRHRSLGPVTEAEAEAARCAIEDRLGTLAAAGPAFDAWAVTYSTWHSREYPDSYFRVEQILRTHLIPYFGATPLLAITKTQAEDYKQRRLALGAAPATVAKELRTLQAMLNRAVFLDQIPRNPIAGVRPPRDLASRPPRWYTADELSRIYAAQLDIRVSTSPENAALAAPYRWSWQLMANTGLRRAEALHLTWRDIGKEEIRVCSTPEQRTKSGRWRLVPISEGAAEALDALKGRTTILPPVRSESISRAFDRALTRADLDGSIHCLRHTYCSHLVQAGVPLRTVQVLAGHASYTTTERYAHLAPSTLRASVAKLHL